MVALTCKLVERANTIPAPRPPDKIRKHRAQEGGFILAVKNNQPSLHAEMRQAFARAASRTAEVDTFHDFAHERGSENVQVQLEPGDLYFFNTRLIHEVPGVAGTEPRIVLAAFIGYSSDRPDIFVWS